MSACIWEVSPLNSHFNGLEVATSWLRKMITTVMPVVDKALFSIVIRGVSPALEPTLIPGSKSSV